MKQFDNIFFALTPIQLINAYEAKHAYGINDNESLLVLFAENSITINQLRSVLKLQKWNKILFLFDEIKSKDGSSGSNFFLKTIRIIRNIIRCQRLLRNIKKTSVAFLGNIDNPYMHYLSCRLINTKKIVLDEGNNTVRRMRWNSGSEEYYIGGPFSNNKKNRIFRILGHNKYIPKTDLTFFSVFENLIQDQRVQYRQNFFNYTRRVFDLDTKESSNEVWFLGAPFLALGMLETKQYFNLLKTIEGYYSNYQFIYIQHRAEREKELPALETRLFDYPVEYQLLNEILLPKKIISFHSGASINIFLLFKKIQVVNFELTDSVMKSGKLGQGRIELYKYYKEIEADNMINLPLSVLI